MTDPFTLLKSLHRPQLLIQAAHLGLEEYNRTSSLRRLLLQSVPPTPSETFPMLVSREAELDAARREGSAAYSVSRHVEMLAALIIEARLLRHASV